MKETNVLISSGVDRFTKSLSTYNETLRKERLCQFSNCEHPSGAYTEYMEYMSLSWWSIKWHVEFLDYGLLLTMKLLNQGFLVVKLKSSLWKFYGRHLHMFNFVVSQFCTLLWVIIAFLSRATRHVPPVEQKLLTLL
jgi:hypothetical protein